MNIRRSDIVFFFALILGLYVAWLARDVLLLIYMSALFAVVFSPALRLIRKIKIGAWQPGRGLALLVIVVCGVVLIILFTTFMLPPIFRDIRGLAAYGPTRAAELLEKARHIPYVDRINVTSFQEHLGAAAGGVVGVFTGIAGGLFWFFSWLILTAYFILDGDRAFHWFVSLFPAPTRSRLEPTMIRAEARIRNWLVGQAASMTLLGFCSLVFFWAFKIKYYYALALIAGLANIVPIVGPITAAVLGCTVAAFDSWTKFFAVAAFFFIYNQLDSAFFTPRIMKTTVDLPPLSIIIALSLGATLAGVLGAIVAVPTAALVAVFLDEYLVKPHRQEDAQGIRAAGA